MLERFADAHVLVVDDNETNLQLMQRLLERAGLRDVHLAADPVAAFAGLTDVEPDLVLLDLHMPKLNGYEFLERLGERYAGQYVPVMVLTADASQEATRRALNLGARDFLTKPFDVQETILRVGNLLETRYLYKMLRRHSVVLREQLNEYQETERRERERFEVDLSAVEEVIDTGGFSIVYQPVIDLTTETMVSVEALARFGDGTVSPDRWLAKAATVGLDTKLELEVIRTALSSLDSLPEPVRLAVNASPGALLAPDLTRLCAGHDCSRLVLELTEHVPVDDYEAVTSAFNELRHLGAQLAVDDTGAGYASFRHLLGLDPSIVKLDMSLTRGIDQDSARRALAAALVSFTRDTDRILVAEGVETASELEALRELGVTFVQGYYLGRPQRLAELVSSPELS